MQNIERLQLYLNRKPYFDYGDYEQFLQENGLDPYTEYKVENDKREMLQTVYDVLQCLANDIDNFRRIETEFVTTSAAEQYLEKRLKSLKADIDKLEDIEKQDGTDSVTGYFFFNS